MSDNSGWYARKMAQMRGVQVAPQRDRMEPIPQHYQPSPQYQQPPQYQEPLHYQPPQPPPAVTIDNLWDAMKTWRGGKAHRVDSEPCPECGSNQFYSRSEGARRGPPPAPHCYNCGYNGLFEQGEATTWGATS